MEGAGEGVIAKPGGKDLRVAYRSFIVVGRQRPKVLLNEEDPVDVDNVRLHSVFGIDDLCNAEVNRVFLLRLGLRVRNLEIGTTI